MVTIYIFSFSYCCGPLVMTQFCSIDSILRIKSITLVDASDLEHCIAWVSFSSIWKERYYFRVEVVSDLSYENCYFFYIAMNQILLKSGDLVQWHCDSFWGEFQRTVHSHHQKNHGTCCSDIVIVYYGSLKLLIIIITQQNLVP